MSTKFQISQNTTFMPPMVYPSAWRPEKKAGGVWRRRAPLLCNGEVETLDVK
jgi:hypothetical protein